MRKMLLVKAVNVKFFFLFFFCLLKFHEQVGFVAFVCCRWASVGFFAFLIAQSS